MTSAMTALAIIMVKNEADIIEACIRHNLNYVNLFVVIDNGSMDGTRDILDALRDEGLPILIFDDPIFGYFQSEKMTEVYRRVVPVFQPDLVYLIDADEFIGASDRASLEGFLSKVPIGWQALLPWVTYIPNPGVSKDAMLQAPFENAPWRRINESPRYHKAVIRRNPADDNNILIEQGNHSIRFRDGRAVPEIEADNFFMAHLPVRSADQITVKAVNGWQAYVVKNRDVKFSGAGSQWAQLYQRVIKGGVLKAEDVVHLALGYAQKNKVDRSLGSDAVLSPMMGLYGSLKYLSKGAHDPLAKIAINMQSYFAYIFKGASSCLNQVPMDVAALTYILRMYKVKSFFSGDYQWFGYAKKVYSKIFYADFDSSESILLDGLTPDSASDSFSRLDINIVKCAVVLVDNKCTVNDFEQILSICWESGWEVDLMATLSLRALATYAYMRQGGVVLRPANPDVNQAKILAVRQALVMMFAGQNHWVDPMPQVVEHPFQNLKLEGV